ncbi:MAG: hypothetical protein WAO20_16100 [Acidobacteriota bacterium]
MRIWCEIYFSENGAAQFEGRYTPTYINPEAGGNWCSPWWPSDCRVVSNSNYSNQFEMSAGVARRF